MVTRVAIFRADRGSYDPDLLACTEGTESAGEPMSDDCVRVTGDGIVEAVGVAAARRLRERAGTFTVLATPADLVVLKRWVATDDEPARSCLLFGEIGAFGKLHEVIQFLGHARWRGELVVESGDARRSLFLDEGHVVAAESNAPEEALGAVLEREGVLTHEQTLACAKTKSEGSLRFGEAAVLLGFVDESRLFREMGRRTDAIFNAIARVRSGVFLFLDGFDESQLSFRRKQPVEVLLLDAIRQIDEADFFRTRIPTSDHVAIRAATAPPPFDPFGVYAAIDGRRSIAALCASRSASELEVTRAVYELVQSGHVTIVPPATDVKHVVDVYNGAIGFLLCELDAMGAGDGVREKLAKFASDAQYKEFFDGAGPADDGTLDGAVIAARVAVAADPAAAEQQVGSQLYDYASYALFLARPHLERRDREHTSSGSAVSTRVAGMLARIAPGGGPTMTPPNGSTLTPPNGAARAGGGNLSATARLPRARLDDVSGVAATRSSTARLPAFTGGAALEPTRAKPAGAVSSEPTPHGSLVAPPACPVVAPFSPMPSTIAAPTDERANHAVARANRRATIFS